ncbi:hypothetical protein D6201_01980 [Aurantiacibacter aquimixticola]|uniref:Uncharacterized protein n=2 Tax=Aurantiacibacter aquimixticola TaxID=1958945 RepID=A0A419RR93_9SPHN|nr:hypothetical protein D6201_01980 [Aurantiacibacter aquimixticola]
MLMATPAVAQDMDADGDELRGQTVDVVFADGTRNSIFFGSTGVATISNTTGQTATANWFVRGDELCLQSSLATECYDYDNRFVAGRAYSLASDCQTAVWTARAVNPPRQMVAPTTGERG